MAGEERSAPWKDADAKRNAALRTFPSLGEQRTVPGRIAKGIERENQAACSKQRRYG